MPFYRMPGLGIVHIKLSGKARKNPVPACSFFVTVKGRRERCMQMTHYLCDWPGCDIPICGDHALELADDLHVCPTHNHQRGLLSRLLPAPQGLTS
jgi:hypothetical protein